jgi:hypothetical protein
MSDSQAEKFTVFLHLNCRKMMGQKELMPLCLPGRRMAGTAMPR